jgi:hypothetical protein
MALPQKTGMPRLAGISLTTPRASYRKQGMKGQGDFGAANGAFLLCDLRSKRYCAQRVILRTKSMLGMHDSSRPNRN